MPICSELNKNTDPRPLQLEIERSLEVISMWNLQIYLKEYCKFQHMPICSELNKNTDPRPLKLEIERSLEVISMWNLQIYFKELLIKSLRKVNHATIEIIV